MIVYSHLQIQPMLPQHQDIPSQAIVYPHSSPECFVNNTLSNTISDTVEDTQQTSKIPNFSMIYAGQFFDIDQNGDGTNDALWCQSANNGSDIGLWYYPNGTQVPLFTRYFDYHNAPSPVFSNRFTGQIALARRAGLSGYEGLYTCIIPDENGVNQTLVVGAYRSVTYNSNGQ